MRFGFILSCLVTFLFSSCNDLKQDFKSQSISENWQFSEENDTTWMSANVPGTVQTDLLNLDMIPHPFKLNNEDSIQWISERNWIYRTKFSVNEEVLQKTKHLLNFGGLDTYASVFLNDSLLISTNNAFRSWEVDVSDILQLENNLKIKFQSTDSIEDKKASKLKYSLPEAPRVFTRKPQFQYGWDWGPTIKTMGIIRDISLQSYTTARLKDVFLQTKSISDSLAILKANIEIEASEYNEINLEIENKTTGNISTTSFVIDNNKTQYSVPITIKNPNLWWTHNLGDPYLYEFEIRLKQGRKTIDVVSKKVGIRSIELISEKDNHGDSFYFKLNGKPVYMKGANYIPQNIFLPEITSEKRIQLLNDVVDANMNMLRVWGGGVYEEDEFYSLCDEKGILIWQDFMFACAMYPGDAEFLENVKQEAIENVKRLRQHPSIALWCGNNENSEGWHRWGWKDGKTEAQQQEIWEGYYATFNHILPRVIDSLQPSVSYWESSPKFGRGDKRYQFEGDAHDWWVWHDGYPFEHFEEEVPRFMSEYGFQSFPSIEAIHYFTKQDSIDISHPSFKTHQKHARGFSLIREYMERDFPVPTDAEDYVYVSQLLQAHGITKGINAHRRAKPYNMGTLYWQLNDCWPVVSWSSIDGLGNWKALHFKAKKAFENILISTEEKDDVVEIFVVNDTFSEISDTLQVKHMDFKGNILSEEKTLVKSEANSSSVLKTFSFFEKEFDTSFTFLKITYGNEQYLHYFSKPKNLKLDIDEIDSEIIKNEDGFLITLQSETLQKDVFLSFDKKGKISDNYFDLLPNESKTVQFYTKMDNIELKVKTLNQLINKK
ncbi:MAG: glycoside hydrolase family 2 protein [Flavobacteriaceae bacterium]|nr:glycoside hydrolase family 2 protein [Flavobacteriaceae bacterium]